MTDAVAEVVRETAAVQAIEDSLRAANQTQALANFANAVTGIYGISGSGKSSLADTAAEFAWEMFQATTLCYLTDLGGFGNKRISLIRLGIMRVYDPRNHTNPFETMEMISLGAFPEHILDPETGRADPNVRLILPRRIVTSLICPQGHAVAKFDNPIALQAAQVECPTCKMITSITNGTTSGAIVRHRMFKTVGHRIYDSMTEMNDWGMMRLGEMSAKGSLPRSENTGGSALGAADMLREGSVVYGGGSAPQVGFMQNRTYQWIANIRSIPDQVVPATLTFAVEQGKADDDSGGVPILGPQISGNARTAKVPRWVGSCLHASREPNNDGNMVHRLWLTTHLDRRDVRNIPYLAKHRGIPLDMPDYLEDPWDADKAKRDAAAWSVCSLRVFYVKLLDQLTKLEAMDRAKYPNAPGMYSDNGDGTDSDEIIGAVSQPAAVTLPAPGPRVAGGQTLGARRGALRVPGQTAVAPAPIMGPQVATAPLPAPSPMVPVTMPPAPAAALPTTAVPVNIPAPASPIVQQLKASLAAATMAAEVSVAAAAATTPPTAPTPPADANAAALRGALRSPTRLRTPGHPVQAAQTAPVPTPAAPAAPIAPAPVVAAPVATATPTATAHATTHAPTPAPAPRIPARRIPRPPV